MKTCSHPGCINPVWGNGVCRNHTPRTLLKKTIFKTPPRTIEGHNKAERRDNFFMSIWVQRWHKCQICGKHLGKEPMSYMFDHLLEKSKHPELTWEPDNILLVCLECHDKKSRGIIGDKYREKINFVKTKFNVS